MSKDKRKFDLEERLIDFAVRIIRTAESLPKTKVGNHIAGQLIRCGTSPAPNYGEAQSAESIADFLHKMKVCLKELRETRVWLLMIVRTRLIKPESKLESLIDENNELISIFVKSVNTAKKIKEKNHNSIFIVQYLSLIIRYSMFIIRYSIFFYYRYE
jgi:four helix bundle protein